MTCSAPGCTFHNEDQARPASLDLRPFCGYHAFGREMPGSEIYWRPPCACSKYADGFEMTIGGVRLSRHTLRECVEKTPRRGLLETGADGRRKCACGKRLEGVVLASKEFSEDHGRWECTETTVRSASPMARGELDPESIDVQGAADRFGTSKPSPPSDGSQPHR